MKTCTLMIYGVFLVSRTLCRETEENSRPKRSREFVSFITSLPDMLREFSDLWNVLLREPKLDLTSAIFRSKEHEILGKISTLNQDFRKLGHQVSGQHDQVVRTIMASLPQNVKTEIALNELARIIDKINIAHQEFSDYISSMGIANATFPNMTTQHDEGNKIVHKVLILDLKPTQQKSEADKFERETLTSFAYWSTGHGGDSIKTLLGDMHRITLPEHQIRTGLFELLNSQSKECERLDGEKTMVPEFGIYSTLEVIFPKVGFD